MSQTAPDASAKEAQKYPWGYILIAMGLFTGAVTSAFIWGNNRKDTAYEKRIEVLETDKKNCEDENRDLVQNLLIKNGIISSNKQPAVDSVEILLRQELQKKTIKNLKNGTP